MTWLTITSIFLASLAPPGGPAVDGLVHYQTLTPKVSLEAGGKATVTLRVDGRDIQIRLAPYSIRSEDFKLLVCDAEGCRETPAPPSTLYRGRVTGFPDSAARLSIRDGQVRGLIDLGEGNQWFVEPHPQLGTPGAGHILYRPEDLKDTGGVCGNSPENRFFDEEPESLPPVSTRDAKDPGDVFYETRIAIDTDYDLYLANGSSENALTASVEELLNAVEAIYIRDNGIRYKIVALVIRKSQGPYTSTDSSRTLYTLGLEWIANHQDVQRDTVHLLSGKNYDSGVLGVSSLGQSCRGALLHYGTSMSAPRLAMALRTGVTAHELGHMWGAAHCNENGSNNYFQGCCDQPIWMMCATANGTMRLRFSTQSIGVITTHRDRYCNVSANPLPTYTPDPNSPPAPPRNPNYPNNSVGVALQPELAWTATDPDGDSLTFDVEFGEQPGAMTYVAQGIRFSTYTAQAATTTSKSYYWRVTAYDTHLRRAASSIWKFTTTDGVSTPLPSATPGDPSTATPSPSQTPTPTPGITSTPTPTRTLTPTPSPAWTPTPEEIPLWWAGYWDTRLSTTTGGQMRLQAIPWTTAGFDGIMEIFHEGIPTGLYVSDDGRNGDLAADDGIWTFGTNLAPGIPAVRFLLELAITPSRDSTEVSWPYLFVR